MKKTKTTIGIKVPFFPTSREFKVIRNELHDSLDQLGESGFLILGPKVSEFEEKMAKKVNRLYCVSCASGTDAITLALQANNIGVGDEVILPANSYPTIFGVALSHASPVLIDVERNTANLDPKQLKKKITHKTKAIIIVHLYGLSANINEIKSICKENKILLIEDCAQAVGSIYKKKPVGSFGDMAIFSFYPTKNLGALGDGGAIVTNTKRTYEKLKMLRMYGERNRYDSIFVGRNSRLDEIQAAFLLVKMRYLEKWLLIRKQLATIYFNNLVQLKNLTLPLESSFGEHSFHLFVIRTKQRNNLRKWLKEQGIETGIHYPKPIHFTTSFSYTGNKGSFPEAEQWSKEALSLPLHPFLTKKEIKYVTKQIQQFFSKTI
ncbi:hypothetical protein COW99_04310 [Candidatus Roizmanbacteria bacterium CG22_combo_CG10-13_8_21_14_all_38_20]|uniref:Erythromycin biosynthesis sensory transduction protein eryC1 n=1 Tax=Candidatus Roizmanbacteria bacterium CG22_combo_CG10-13_8_21_14_all_38_20 TaxID=1974862 RepID=A0A2H0BUN7_9BACT|nr:MAG: hypothetical protein COW99_04310 [Candidatus Roizmanbacteria bacterium CG22_combo_CG10-13_8_21_14_all_38_20]PJC30518.1 MAG: hypothetical protein CO050_06050 [Candidatus Roizmanbacteria bacterium CG_4_9_14_0_2_um_filter_38_17]